MKITAIALCSALLILLCTLPGLSKDDGMQDVMSLSDSDMNSILDELIGKMSDEQPPAPVAEAKPEPMSAPKEETTAPPEPAAETAATTAPVMAAGSGSAAGSWSEGIGDYGQSPKGPDSAGMTGSSVAQGASTSTEPSGPESSTATPAPESLLEGGDFAQGGGAALGQASGGAGLGLDYSAQSAGGLTETAPTGTMSSDQDQTQVQALSPVQDSTQSEPLSSTQEEPLSSTQSEPLSFAQEEPLSSTQEEPLASTQEGPLASTQESYQTPAPTQGSYQDQALAPAQDLAPATAMEQSPAPSETAAAQPITSAPVSTNAGTAVSTMSKEPTDEEIKNSSVAIAKEEDDQILITVGDKVYLPVPSFKALRVKNDYNIYTGTRKKIFNRQPDTMWYRKVGKLKVIAVNDLYVLGVVMAANDVIRKGDVVYINP